MNGGLTQDDINSAPGSSISSQAVAGEIHSPRTIPAVSAAVAVSKSSPDSSSVFVNSKHRRWELSHEPINHVACAMGSQSVRQKSTKMGRND